MITQEKFNFTDISFSAEDRLKWIQSLKYESFKPEVNNEKVFEVDLNTKTITVPKTQSELGVQDDTNAEIFWFAVPRYFEGKDLGDKNSKKWLIHVTTANPDAKAREILLPIKYVEKDKVINTENLTFGKTDGILLGWEITYDITKYPGNVSFALRCYEIGTEGEDKDKIIFSLGTKPAVGKIVPSYSLDVNAIPDSSSSIFPTTSIVTEMLMELQSLFGADGTAQISYSNLGRDGMPSIDNTQLLPSTNIKFASINGTKISNTETDFKLATQQELESANSAISNNEKGIQTLNADLKKANDNIDVVAKDVKTNQENIQTLNTNLITATNRIFANEDSIKTIEGILGGEGDTEGTIVDRIDALETDVDTIQKELGISEDGSTSETSLITRVGNLEAKDIEIEADIESIQTALGLGEEGTDSENSLLDRVDILETVLGIGGEGEIPEGSLPEKVQENKNAIDSILNGTNIDSFKDVEDQLAAIDISDQLDDIKDSVFKDNRFTGVENDVDNNAQSISNLSFALSQNNDNLKIQYEESESMLYLFEGETLIKGEDGNVLGSAVIKGGGGGPTLNYSLLLKRIDEDSQTVRYGDSAVIKFKAEFKDGAGDLESRLLNFKITSGSYEDRFTRYSNQEIEFDVSPYLVLGDNNIKITVSYSEIIGDNETPTTIQSSKTWLIKTVDLYFEDNNFEEKEKVVQFGTIPYTATVFGDLEKTLYVKVDGEEYQTIKNITQTNYSCPINFTGLTHGSHSIEVYLEGKLSAEKTIRTDSKFYEVLYADPTNLEPIIRLKAIPAKVEQYDTVFISFTSYISGYEEKDFIVKVDDVVLYEGKIKEDTIEQPYTPMDFGTQVITASCINPRTGERVEKTIELTVDEFRYKIEQEKAGLALDFLPKNRSNSADDYNIFYNNADYREEIGDITWTLSDNFDWINGGWKTDENSSQYFCIKAGTFATFNYDLFKDPNVITNGSAAGNGKEFKIIFKTDNVAKSNAEFLTCKDNSGIGLVMNVHEAYLTSNNTSLYIPYAEQEIIEIDININPAKLNGTTLEPVGDIIPMAMAYEDGTPYRPQVHNDAISYTQKTPCGIKIGSMDCDVHLYRLKAYTNNLTEKQILNNYIADARNALDKKDRYVSNDIYNAMTGVVTPESLANARPDLKIIKIVCPRFTNKKSDFVKLTSVEMVHKNGDPFKDNWKFENCILSGQGTTSDNYGDAARNLDLICCFDGEYYNKKIWEYTFNKNDEEYYAYKTSLTLNPNGGDEAQDNSFEKGGDGKVALSESTYPNNYFNVKVNVASSENANNALMQNRYDEFLPYKIPSKKKDKRIKTTMDFVNCVVFVCETDPDTAFIFPPTASIEKPTDTDFHFYAIGNIGDSKKTDQGRAYDPEDHNEFCVEILDNDRPNSSFQTGYKDETDEKGLELKYPISKDLWREGNPAYDALYSNTWDGEDTESFEMRYEHPDASKEEINANRTLWHEFYEWVITSSDEEFKNELSNWFILNAALYYYLYTERYTMMDNRAKNSFYHWAKHYISEEEAETMGPDKAALYVINNEAAAIHNGYRFDFWDYDNDTALGINNDGKMTYPYGQEDIDTELDGTYVFNAGESVFFRRIRKLFRSELEVLYRSPDLKGLWDPTLLNKRWDEWQNEFPEALWIEDALRKYYRTYREKTNTDHLKVRFQGRKKYHRHQWEKDQAEYMSSKYVVPDEFTTIVMRAVTPPNPVVPFDYTYELVPYSDMYLNVFFGSSLVKECPLRAKAGESYSIKVTENAVQDSQMSVLDGHRIQSFGDLSTFYAKNIDFVAAEKIKSLKVGSEIEGYENINLDSLSLDANKNKLLEYLDIRNLKGLQSVTLPLNLRELYAQGSGLTNAIFTSSGLIQKAYLPATVQNIRGENLYYLETLELESYNNLVSLILMDCNYDALSLVEKANNLTELTLNNIDWNLDTADLLNKLVQIDSDLKGKVYIEVLKQSEHEAFMAKWPELEISYNEEKYVTQYKINFYREQGEESPIYVKIVNSGYLLTSADDPSIQLIEQGLLKKDSNIQYHYEFEGWSPTISSEEIYENKDFYGTYRSIPREYTVSWYSDSKGTVITNSEGEKATVTVQYGQPAVYDMNKFGIPTKNTYAVDQQYHLFAKWDKSTGFVQADMNVYPVWESSVPNAPAGTASKDLTPAQIWALSNRPSNDEGEFDGEYQAANGLAKFIKDGEAITVQLGYIPDYNGITLIEEDTHFDGTASKVIDTGYKLFDEDKNFTIMIDYTMKYKSSKTTNTLLSCKTGERGVRLYSSYSSSQNIYDIPKVEWNGDQSTEVSKGAPGVDKTYREICTIRHRKGDSNLYVCFGKKFFSTNVTEDKRKTKEIVLSGIDFAAAINSNLFIGGEGSSNLGVGTVHFAKLWFDDLGEKECEKICSWTTEKITFSRCQTNLYTLANDPSSNKAKMSFVADVLLDEDMVFDYVEAYDGGWQSSDLRKWIQEKMLNGLSIQWQQIIQPVKIKSLYGSTGPNQNQTAEKNGQIVTTEDKLYIPAYAEVDSSATDDATYSKETTDKAVYSVMSSASARARSYPNGKPGRWWTRTPYKAEDELNQVIGMQGAASGNYGWDTDDNGNSVGYWPQKKGSFGVLLAFSIGGQ